MKTRFLIIAGLIAVSAIPACASLMTHRVEFYCNSDAEKPFIQDAGKSAIVGTLSRYVEGNGSWTYRFAIPAGADCRASLDAEGKGVVSLSVGKSRATSAVNLTKQSSVSVSVRPGSNDPEAFVKVQSQGGEIRVQRVAFEWTDRDSNANGISDAVEKMMGGPRLLEVNRRPAEPHTSFQTPIGYTPENDIRTDAVIVYQPGKEAYDSWKSKGYVTQTMYGFRTGDDYIKDHRDEGQTGANGDIFTCGPGSYYMVPTKSRIDAALKYFGQAIDSGSVATIPEEPEFFTNAGYADSFKREWQAYYNEPWQDPATSIETRWKAGRLMGEMEYRMVKSIADFTKAKNPSVRRMVAEHSQISYYHGGIVYPHYKVLQIPSLDEVVAQVWTGTSRDASKYEGVSAERTFEWGYLEYSSLYNLMRGAGKRVWFLMDPLEDNPDRTMEDYQENYEKTLIGSLMFPGVDEFEVMPWPTRIYGRVPDWFATKIGTIVGMLGDIHNQKTSELDAGTQGIATFVSDSMAWQRAEPYPSSFDTFYGMTLPLFMKGIPVQVAQLERTPEPKYLAPYKVLLVSYDMLKPMSPDYNTAIAKWVNDGGSLILFGGTDPYNALNEWWTKAGLHSPQEDLLAKLGINPRESASLVADRDPFAPLISEPNKYHNAENHRIYTLDLTNHVLPDGHVYVRFEDAFKGDGWGPLVSGAKLIVDGRTAASFAAGSDEERKHIADDDGSQFNGSARFADAQTSWTYEFAVPTGKKVELAVDMANQFKLSVATKPVKAVSRLSKAANSALTARYPELSIPKSNEITTYAVDASPIYSVDGSKLSPFFEKRAGKGNVILVGIAPKYFATSKEAAEQFRSIVSYGCSKVGLPYKEQGYIKIRRGRYVALRSFDQPVTLSGSYVDVLDPALRFVVNPKIPVDGRAVMADVTSLIADPAKTPRVLLSASRVEAKVEDQDHTSVLVTGPLKTKGVTRISTAGRSIADLHASDTTGKPVPVTRKEDQGTLSLTYDNLPEGVVIKVGWRR